ncbi:MAG: hypothetical protein ACRDON_12600 [Gaiellaceae bacterium]
MSASGATSERTGRLRSRSSSKHPLPAGDSREIDYDLHGLVGIRLVDASPRDAAAVTRQLGPIQARLEREPDIVIRFVDRLATSSRLRHLGVEEAGFTDDAFLVLRSKHKAPAKVQIAFTEIGERCEIVCERGLPAVPLLIPIVNLTVLHKGAVPLHASAFVHDGTGVVATGWSKGGKTEAMLAFVSRGAQYVGDEWVYITGDGERVFGIPEPIRVWDWHLQELPRYRALAGRGERVRLRAIKSLLSLEGVFTTPRARSLALARGFRRVAPLLRKQLFVDIPPERLVAGGLGTLSGGFERLFFLASHDAPDVRVEPIDPLEVGRRMVFSLQHERLPFMTYYLMFRFAFPDRRNPVIEEAEELQREALERVLAGKPAYAVYHPYPASIPALFDAMSPYC